jgi:hypothetical protein
LKNHKWNHPKTNKTITRRRRRNAHSPPGPRRLISVSIRNGYNCARVVKQAFEYKEQGNEFFKQGDYKRALAKYARVQAFTNAIQPIKNQEVAMFQNLSKKGKVRFSMITYLEGISSQ